MYNEVGKYVSSLPKTKKMIGYFINSKIEWSESTKIPPHYSLKLNLGKKSNVFMFLTSKEITLLDKQYPYKNYKMDENSYINPPLLVPEELGSKFSKTIKSSPVDPTDFCNKFKCENLFIGHMRVFKNFIKMMSTVGPENEILMSSIGVKGSFKNSIQIWQFDNDSKAGFLNNTIEYFEDDNLKEFIEFINDNSLEMIKFFNLVESNEFLIKLIKETSELINKRDGTGLNEGEMGELESNYIELDGIISSIIGK